MAHDSSLSRFFLKRKRTYTHCTNMRKQFDACAPLRASED